MSDHPTKQTTKAPSVRVVEIHPISADESGVKLAFEHGAPSGLTASFHSLPVQLENVSIWHETGTGATAAGLITATFPTPREPGVMGFYTTGSHAYWVECIYPEPKPEDMSGFLEAMHWLRRGFMHGDDDPA